LSYCHLEADLLSFPLLLAITLFLLPPILSLNALYPSTILISQVGATVIAAVAINAITIAVVIVVTIEELRVLILIVLRRIGFGLEELEVEYAVRTREERVNSYTASARGDAVSKAKFGSQVAACFLNSVG
jgi:hypothetical protein